MHNIINKSLSKFYTLLPDKLFLKLKYRKLTGKKLNIKNPLRFTEKIQWLKLYDRNSIYTIIVDKMEVKDYVKNIIGEEYIIPTIACWENPNDLDIHKLNTTFVVKTTMGGGNCGVIVCNKQTGLNIDEIRNLLSKNLNYSIYKNFREWPYKNVKPRIIAEEYIEMPGKESLTDFKIFCFNGVPKYIQVIQDRNEHETIDFFDTEWNHQPFVGLNPNCKNADMPVPKPKNLEKMIEIAEKLSKDIPFVRVDLYNIDGKIYFGEMTFYPGSGFGRFSPDEWDFKLGEMLTLPER